MEEQLASLLSPDSEAMKGIQESINKGGTYGEIILNIFKVGYMQGHAAAMKNISTEVA